MIDELEDAAKEVFEGWNALYSRLGLLRQYAGGSLVAPLQEDMERLLDRLGAFIQTTREFVENPAQVSSPMEIVPDMGGDDDRWTDSDPLAP